MRSSGVELRARLASVNLDGPYHFPEGFAPLLSGSRDSFAVCLTCGAMILLSDPQESEIENGDPIERSATLHVRWHAQRDDPEETT